MSVVLWRDMVGVGTCVNLAATFAALLLASQGAPVWLFLFVHFATVPYNVFLFAAVEKARPRFAFARLVAVTWLVLMTVA